MIIRQCGWWRELECISSILWKMKSTLLDWLVPPSFAKIWVHVGSAVVGPGLRHRPIVMFFLYSCYYYSYLPTKWSDTRSRFGRLLRRLVLAQGWWRGEKMMMDDGDVDGDVGAGGSPPLLWIWSGPVTWVKAPHRDPLSERRMLDKKKGVSEWLAYMVLECHWIEYILCYNLWCLCFILPTELRFISEIRHKSLRSATVELTNFIPSARF